MAAEPPLPADVAKPRFRLADVTAEALDSLLVRPARAALTILGTVLGIGAIVATLGVSSTAGNQIVGRFDALASTYVVIEPREGIQAGEGVTLRVIPWDADARLHRLNGVVAAATLSEVDIADALVRSVPINDPLSQTRFQMRVFAGSSRLPDVVGAAIATGRYFDAGHSGREDRVAVLGPVAAERLRINRVEQHPAIFVGDETFVVIGTLGGVESRPELLDSVIIPEGTARARFALDAPGSVQIRTELGAAQLIASQAATAVSPSEPALLQVIAPTDPRAVRDAVAEDINAMFLILGAVSLVIGAIGIANVTLVSVLERIGEIGLRRSVGAARRHIAIQFLAESAATGFVGGVLGASAGVLVVVAIAATRGWTPVLDPVVPLAAPLVGGLVGLIAGVYPATRAARLEPIEALRAGT